MDMWSRGGYVGQGWICGAEVAMWDNRVFCMHSCILLPWKRQPFWCTASIDFHCAPKWGC